MSVPGQRSPNWSVPIVALGAALASGILVLLDFVVGQWKPVDVAGIVLFIVSLAASVWWFRRARPRLRTIRSRLLVSFVLLALLAVIGASLSAIVVGSYNGRRQALQRLDSVAAFRVYQIQEWTHSRENEVSGLLDADFAREAVRVLLGQPQAGTSYSLSRDATQERLRRFCEQSSDFREAFILNLRGTMVASSDPGQSDTSGVDTASFQRGLASPYSKVVLPATVRDRPSVLVFVPIIVDNQAPGVLVARAPTSGIAGILQDGTGLGKTGGAYLVDSRRAIFTGSDPQVLDSASTGQSASARATGAGVAVANEVNGSGVFNDYRGSRVIGVFRWLADLRVALVAQQDVAEAFGAVYITLAINVSIALAFVLLAVLGALFMTRSITRPLLNLVGAASRIASGDLAYSAPAEELDEVSALANSFNFMTAQLRDLVGGLERRVDERTRALQERALQLETSARIGREITSILRLDALLNRVAETICSAFGYYSVLVFLVDEGSKHLVSITDGSAIRPAQHVDIDRDSLNGEAVVDNAALIVNDVSRDPRFLKSAMLPRTQSELVVPLRVGKQVLGTLDVQSDKINAFRQDDLLVMQSLGDQIAVAIENARLYQRSLELAVVEERNRLGRELHDSVSQLLSSLVVFAGAGQELIDARKVARTRQQLVRIEETAREALGEMRLLIHQLRPPALEQEGLVGMLRQRLHAVESRSGIRARLFVKGSIELAPVVVEGLYRIAQEALNNALRHARCGSIRVEVRADDGHVELEVIDDGVGFDIAAASVAGGLGLASMRERAGALGGTLVITSAPNQGASIRVSIEAPGSSRGGTASDRETL